MEVDEVSNKRKDQIKIKYKLDADDNEDTSMLDDKKRENQLPPAPIIY